jgi:hypothetical protein
MKVLEQCRCSFDVGPPPPRHAHSHPICSKFSPVSLFFPFFSSGSLLFFFFFFFFPSQALEILPLLSAIDRASDRFLGAPKASSQKQQRTKNRNEFYVLKCDILREENFCQ